MVSGTAVTRLSLKTGGQKEGRMKGKSPIRKKKEKEIELRETQQACCVTRQFRTWTLSGFGGSALWCECSQKALLIYAES